MDGDAGLARALTAEYAMILLDVMLPKKNGFELCRELRQRGIDTAILMLTARTHVVDRVAGLKLGADDYMAKPFDPRELLARVEALLRRVRSEKRIPLRTFRFADIDVNFERAEVFKAGELLYLASKELGLLQYLVQNRGRIVPREELLEEVWGYRSAISSRTLDVHIAWLRQKIDNPANPRHIQTVRGIGYQFNP
jgi:DNA-binding response OmpR family regulator